MKFGFLPGLADDFDSAYSLTMVRKSTEKVEIDASKSQPPDAKITEIIVEGGPARKLLFKSMACVYVIAAAGPAMPDVRTEPYNGATCMWERVQGVGENYFVDYDA